MFAPAADGDGADLAFILHAEVEAQDAAEGKDGEQRQADDEAELRHAGAVPRVLVDGGRGGRGGEDDGGPGLDVGVAGGRGAAGDGEEHGLVRERPLVAVVAGGLVEEPFLVRFDVDEAECVGGLPLWVVFFFC